MSEYEFETKPLILRPYNSAIYTEEEALAWRLVAETLAEALKNTARSSSGVYLGWHDALTMYEDLKQQFVDREVEYLDYETGQKVA